MTTQKQPLPDRVYWVFGSRTPGDSYGPFIDRMLALSKANEINGIVLGVRVTYTGVRAQVQAPQ